jgi:hypothetical protein
MESFGAPDLGQVFLLNWMGWPGWMGIVSDWEYIGTIEWAFDDAGKVQYIQKSISDTGLWHLPITIL